MPRMKKSRKAKGFIDDSGPSRQERLADPESYDSRKRKALEAKKKKHKSAYEKKREAEKTDKNKNAQAERKTRLADKIRRMNKEKSQD
ncbi:MAG: hypothetical protein ACRBB6_09100 [Neptuniibacter sp.]